MKLLLIFLFFYSTNIFSQDSTIIINRLKDCEFGISENCKFYNSSPCLLLYSLNDIENLYNTKIILPSKIVNINKDFIYYSEINSLKFGNNNLIDSVSILILNLFTDSSKLLINYNSNKFDFSNITPIEFKIKQDIRLRTKNFNFINYTIIKPSKDEKIFGIYSYPYFDSETITNKEKLLLRSNLNLVYDIKLKSDSFSIAIFDKNQDGVIENNKDIISIGIYKNHFVKFDTTLISTKSIKPINSLKIGTNFYSLIIVDTLIYIKKSKTTSSYISFFENINQLSFIDINDSINYFNSYVKGEKYLYLDFWMPNCAPCVRGFNHLNKIKNHYSNKIEIIGLLNYGDKTILKKNIDQYNISFKQGIANQSIISNFLVTGYPYGILIDSSGKILNYNVTPEELEYFLENK